MALLPRYGDLNHNWVSLQWCVHLVWLTVSLLLEDRWALLLLLQSATSHLDFTSSPSGYLCRIYLWIQVHCENDPFCYCSSRFIGCLKLHKEQCEHAHLHTDACAPRITAFVWVEHFSKGMLLCRHRWCSWQKHDCSWKLVHMGTLTELLAPGSLYISCIKAAWPRLSAASIPAWMCRVCSESVNWLVKNFHLSLFIIFHLCGNKRLKTSRFCWWDE